MAHPYVAACISAVHGPVSSGLPHQVTDSPTVRSNWRHRNSRTATQTTPCVKVQRLSLGNGHQVRMAAHSLGTACAQPGIVVMTGPLLSAPSLLWGNLGRKQGSCVYSI
jgi:hypothetical protein